MKTHPYDSIRPTNLEDLIEINSWYRARSAPAIPRDVVSPQGLIVPGVAAGYLIRTSTNLAILEGFVSNPEAPAALRKQALDKIAADLIQAARSTGIVCILAITEHGRIKDLCTKYNFTRHEGLEVWTRGNS